MSGIFGSTKRARVSSKNVLETATLRDFTGLWNDSDTDLNLQSRYLPVLTNILPDQGTGLKVRPGYKTFTNLDKPQGVRAQLSVTVGSNVLRVKTSKKLFPLLGAEVQIANYNALTLGGLDRSTINGVHRVVKVYPDEDGLFQGNDFDVLMGDWALIDQTALIDVDLNFVVPRGNIVDLVYFDGQLLGVTDEGYVFGVPDDTTLWVWWSPSIDKAQNHNFDLTAVVTFYDASQFATIALPGADGNPAFEDTLFLTEFDAYLNITAEELNRPHKIVAADQANNIYTIKLPRVVEAAGTTTGAVAYPVNNGWHYSDLVTHDTFNRGVVFTNGVDKPIRYTASPNFAVNYLADPATGTNINVPVSRFVTAGTQYTVMGNTEDDNKQGYLDIASTGTDNTWSGDPPPNDATFINLANVAGTANPSITGIAFFNERLIAAFSDSMAIYSLGATVDDKHKPELVQVVDSFGCISHRSMLTFGENFLVCDAVGVVDVARNLNDSTSLRVRRCSEIIVRHISQRLSRLQDVHLQRVWSLHDKLSGRAYVFVPDGSDYLCYAFTRWPERKIEGWSLIRGWNFSCGTRTLANRLFTARGRTIYQIGNDLEVMTTDDGAPIKFCMETPWIDFNARMLSKKSRYIGVDGEGDGSFTLQMFTDYRYHDVRVGDLNPPVINAEEFDTPLTPYLSMDFTSGDAPGYGAGPQPFGGGRRANDPRLYAFVAEFKHAKFRIVGETNEELKFVALSLAYQRGSIR